MEKTFIEKLIEITEANISNPAFSVDELAQQMGMGYASLRRKIHSLTGKPVKQFIREIRLKKAWEMMRTEDVTISEVAFKLGFNSPSYFTVCFHDFFGYPPGDVKKMNVNGPKGNGSMVISEGKIPAQEPVIAETKKPKPKQHIGSIVFVAATGFLIVLFCLILFTVLSNSDKPTDTALKSREKSIAVLPFKLLSEDPDKQYLADGIMDLLVLHLSRIRDLHVIPSTSVEQYRKTIKTIKTIGQEQNVKYILEGRFLKYGDSVRLIVQLFNAREEPQWDKEYIVNWEKISNVLSQVAQTIASEVKVAVSPEEKMTIENSPTSDTTAFGYYLRGMDYFKQSNTIYDIRLAIHMYEKAIEVDPNYTLAWVGLTQCYRYLFWNFNDGSDVTLSMTEKYLKKSLALSPRLKEVRIEEAVYYYQCKRDFSKSIQLLERLKTDYPNDDEIYHWIGAVISRMGDYVKALENTDHAIRLNPTYWRYRFSAAIILEVIHEYKKAEDYYIKAIDLNPSAENLYNRLLEMYISTGQIQKAIAYLADHELLMDPQDVNLKKAWLATLERNYAKAIQITQLLAEGTVDDELLYTKNLQLGLLYRAINDNTTARRYFEVERDILLKKIRESVYDYHLYAKLGTAYAGLGMKEQALQAGRKALELLNSSNDAVIGCWREMNMVRILIMVGEYDEALVQLDQIIKNTGLYTVEILKLDPFWDPVRNHEKFKEIISNPEYQVKL